MTLPNFANLSRIEEQLLTARLAAARSAISHAGDKGRTLELLARSFLRGLLPKEYGLTTGYIAWLSPDGPELSTQLDIIIYDAIRCGPVITLEGCDVLPLEAIYGYVEIKASLSGIAKSGSKTENSIAACARKNAAIRRMRTRWFTGGIGSPMAISDFEQPWLAPRAYVIAFELVPAKKPNADRFASQMATALRNQGGAHIHGVLIPNVGFFYTRAVNPDALEDEHFHVKYTTDHPLLAFKSLLLKGLSSFERPQPSWSAALHRYYEKERLWIEKTPTKAKVVDATKSAPT